MTNFNTNDFNYSEVSNFVMKDFFNYSMLEKGESKSMKFRVDGETYRLAASFEERFHLKIEKKGEKGYEMVNDITVRSNQDPMEKAESILWNLLNEIEDAKAEEEAAKEAFKVSIASAIEEGFNEAVLVWDAAIDEIMGSNYNEEDFPYGVWKEYIEDMLAVTNENETCEDTETFDGMKSEWNASLDRMVELYPKMEEAFLKENNLTVGDYIMADGQMLKIYDIENCERFPRHLPSKYSIAAVDKITRKKLIGADYHPLLEVRFCKEVKKVEE